MYCRTVVSVCRPLVWAVAALCVAGVLILSTTAQAQAPEPQIVSPSWNLDVQFSDPQVIAVPGPNGVEWYWYMTYEVTNETGEDRLFIPDITVANNAGEIVEANHNISPLAFSMIQRVQQNDLLESPAQIIGTIRQGSDYAKDGVIIWREFDRPYSQFYVFFAGFSGESAVVEHPTSGEEIHFHRTIMLTFDAPGNPPNPQVQLESVTLEERTEVMR